MQKEMSCHKCGAVFFVSETPGPCPNCGTPIGNDLWRFTRGASRYVLWVILAIVWSFSLGFQHADWQTIAVFLAIGALALGFVVVVRKKQQGADLFTGLNPRGRSARDSAIQIAPSSPPRRRFPRNGACSCLSHVPATYICPSTKQFGPWFRRLFQSPCWLCLSINADTTLRIRPGVPFARMSGLS